MQCKVNSQVTLRVLITINMKVIVNIDVCCGIVTLVHRIAGDDWERRDDTGTARTRQRSRDTHIRTEDRPVSDNCVVTADKW